MDAHLHPDNVRVVNDPDGTFRVLDYNGFPMGGYYRVRANAVKVRDRRRSAIQQFIDNQNAQFALLVDAKEAAQRP